MPVTSYISIDGMLYGEVTGGVMRNYGTDALGSVVETVLNGVEENTYQYSPYGRTIAKTGTAADPKFLWNGGSGYWATFLPASDYYVLAPYYSVSATRWTTPTLEFATGLLGYLYAGGNPSSRPADIGGPDCPFAISIAVHNILCKTKIFGNFNPGLEATQMCAQIGGCECDGSYSLSMSGVVYVQQGIGSCVADLRRPCDVKNFTVYPPCPAPTDVCVIDSLWPPLEKSRFYTGHLRVPPVAGYDVFGSITYKATISVVLTMGCVSPTTTLGTSS